MPRTCGFFKAQAFETHMGSWSRFWRLGKPERRVVAEAVWAIAVTKIGLRMGGFGRCREFFERRTFPSAAGQTNGIFIAASEIARLTYSTANSFFFRVSCLERSLALCRMLERRGFASRLQLGARKYGSRFEAHAWVECEGIPLCPLDGEPAGFERFASQKNSGGLMAKEAR